MTVFDYTGQPITIGCRVAYPKRRGSKMWLDSMRVDNIEQAGEFTILLGYDNTGRRTRTRNIKNCVVIGAQA